MRRLLTLVCLALPGVAVGQDAFPYRDAVAALEAFAEKERVAAGIPGLSIAIVEDQKVLWSKGFGHADLAGKRPATPDTIYRVGSVSKLFTDLAVMQLVEEGKIDLDAPVSKYLPNFKPAGPKAETITLRMLMSHRSGLIREQPQGSYFDPEPPSLAETTASVNGIPLVYEPGTRIKYSNAAIGAVGLTVQTLDGRPFPQALRERILRPLGMAASDFEPTPAVKKELSEAMMWTYHGRDFKAPTFELGQAPAGCMYSTVGDLAKFMSAMFAGGKGALAKPETLAAMLKPQFADKDAKEGFGIGFMIGELDGQPRIGHGGAIYGFSTELAFLPKSKLGVVVIANKDVTNSVATRITDTALRLLVAAKEKKPLPALPEWKPVPAETVRKLVGKYGDESVIELVEIDGKLFLLSPNGGYVSEVKAVSGGDFVLGGTLGNGREFRCNGDALTINAPKQRAYRRQPMPEGLPPAALPHFLGLLGEYGWDHNTLFILEKDGKLFALIEWVFLYPLTEETKDVFKFPDAGGLYHGEKLVFTRGDGGKATQVDAARVVFKRRVLDGEDGRTFKIKPQRPVEELRAEAAKSSPPKEVGEFKASELVEIVKFDDTIKTDLRYATDNNFMGVPLYPKSAKAYMQKPAAEALAKVNKKLKESGYGLWVFDSYRPWAVTKMFWEATPENLRTFVADPSKGSRHNRGCAVDLTLYDLKTGKPVDMVGGFDEFSDRSYPNYWGGTSRQRWHRELLRRSMEAEGFSVYEAEWWHFDFNDWRAYPIGNKGFDELGK